MAFILLPPAHTCKMMFVPIVDSCRLLRPYCRIFWPIPYFLLQDIPKIQTLSALWQIIDVLRRSTHKYLWTDIGILLFSSYSDSDVMSIFKKPLTVCVQRRYILFLMRRLMTGIQDYSRKPAAHIDKILTSFSMQYLPLVHPSPLASR